MITALLPIRIAGQLAHWDPHLHAGWVCISRRHHPNYRIVSAVERQRLVQNIRLTAKAPLPQSITENNDGRTAGFVFIVCKDTSDSRVNAQGGKQIS